MLTSPPDYYPRRTRRHSRRRRALLIGLAVVGAIAVLLGGAGGWLYLQLSGNINSFDPNTGNRPPDAAPDADGRRPVNVLIMGSDTRAGANGIVGGAADGGYGNSDTMMIMHIAADHQHAMVMSIPRDTVVQLPACTDAKGHPRSGQLGQVNWAYSIGGPRCALATVEQLTGIRMTHTVVIDFHGFVNMVDDIGGVPICVPKAVNDTIGHIRINAGTYTVKGTAALDYVRERHSFGDGGDRSRITRQHAFLSSMIKKMESTGTLTNPAAMLSLANDTTKSVTVDKPLASVGSLLSFANSIKGIKPSNIKFLTVKTQNYPVGAPMYATFQKQLALVQPTADQEFAAFRSDAPIDGSKPASAPPSASQKPSGAGIKVEVYNGTAHQGLAAKATTELHDAGFAATTMYTSPGTIHPTTLIEYGLGQQAHAQTLAAYFTGAKVQSAHGTTGIRLILGEDYAQGGTGSGQSAAPKPAPAPITTARAATADPCSGIQQGDA